MINKPINPYPYNCCVDLSSNLNIEYEIPNENIDGRYISVNNMETGKSVLESYENLSEPTNKIKWDAEASLSQYGDDEYSWSSFYWQTPTNEPDKTWIVSDIDTQSGAIHIKAEGENFNTLYPEYKKKYSMYENNEAMIGYNYKQYNVGHFNDCGHTLGDDTSSQCSVGVLEDYFTYPCIEVGYEFFKKVKEIGVGKCVIDIWDKNHRLVAQTLCLAYDELNWTSTLMINEDRMFRYYLIIDNANFGESIQNSFETGFVIKTEYVGGAASYAKERCVLYDHAYFYNIEDLNEKEDISGMLNYEDSYCSIRNYNYSTYKYIISTQPVISDKLQIGDVVNMWTQNSKGANFNTSPAYYFRCKSAPQITINDFSQLQTKDKTNILMDVKGKFGISYSSSSCKLNYFYLYIYVFNSLSNKWELQERTPMLHTTDDAYEFVGFYHSQKYKVFAVCTDKDGDEWTSEELEFTIDNPATHISFTTYDIQTVFNHALTTIDVSLEKYLTYYKSVTLEFYKYIRSDMGLETKLEYAGGGMAKIDGNVVFNRWSDYNVCNDTYYDYYIRADYQNNNTSGTEWLLIADNIHTEFCGTSILGLEKVNGTQLKIANSFNILYHLDNDAGELNNELRREYMSSFGKYPKELKGHQNYISSSLSGLLGDERKGVYAEPKGIRRAWNNFVDDDTIKLYRGFDGETMIISIDANKVKPFYYPSVGIVNEVSITFKEIASASQYAIFSTAGD